LVKGMSGKYGMKLLNKTDEDLTVTDEDYKKHGPLLDDTISKIKEMPDYLNPETASVKNKVGDFDYDKYNCEYNKNLPSFGPYKFNDSSVY
jgi:hypothetical protein